MKKGHFKTSILLFMLLAISPFAFAQQLLLGIQGGLSFSSNRQIDEGQSIGKGLATPDYFGGVELKYKDSERMGVGFGFQLSDFSIGARAKFDNSGFGIRHPYCGHFRLHDLYIGLNYSLPIFRDRLFVRAEGAYHQLLGKQHSNALSFAENSNGWNFQTKLQLDKPYYFSAISAGLNLDWQFKNGCILRIGGKYLQGLGSIGVGEIVTFFDKNFVEHHDFKVVPAALQTYIGFDYPISKIWEK